MSSKLWEYFLHDDVEGFERLLASAGYAPSDQRAQVGHAGGGGAGASVGTVVGSPSTLSLGKSNNKKLASPGSSFPDRSGHIRTNVLQLSRAELNARDQYGRTLLHLIASSRKPTAIDFALALLEVPYIDIYAQDWESGWTALHRALYLGNATIARALMARDVPAARGFSKAGALNNPIGGLIKLKDRDGDSPFDIYGATISSRDINSLSSNTLRPSSSFPGDASSEIGSTAPSVNEGDDWGDEHYPGRVVRPRMNLSADEIFTFGSNKNMNLGLGDQDDRQFPERVSLKRPENLLQRFYNEFREQRANWGGPDSHQDHTHLTDLPAIIQNKPIKFQNVVMSKLHTAILTNDPESNLFMCGFGPGGRLGTGDEVTRFSFTCIESGALANKKIVSVALGQDHSLAITDHGEIFSWGTNKFGQLGYTLPRSNNKNDVPTQLMPRQIFNPFKKEIILGAAASSIHSVVFSSSGLYTFGKNEGQLGLVDSDARSLEMQVTPRRVGAALFNCPVQMVSAIDRATAVLLQSCEVWVFTQYGYSKLSFPLDVSSAFIKNSFMATRYDTSVNRIVKIASGSNTICALSSFGEIYTVQVTKPDNVSVATSTTNPNKIRNSLSPAVRAWSLKKPHMAALDVDVGQDGSIILCTNSGSAWRKEKRTKIKEGASKDYKFARIPGLSRVVGVRSNPFGAYAVAQRDCNVTKEQITVDQSTLWIDFLALSPFQAFKSTVGPASEGELQDLEGEIDPVAAIKRGFLNSSDAESRFLSRPSAEQGDMLGGTVWIETTLSEARIPVHEFLISGRSPMLRDALRTFRESYYFVLHDVLVIPYGQDGMPSVVFQGVDFLTILNFAFFLYTDSVIDVWHLAKYSSKHAFRYRQVRTEVMRIASHLGLPGLERAARLMIEPVKTLKRDMARAIHDPAFFNSSDVTIQLHGETVKVHSQVICQRSPFFDAMFRGRSGGLWLAMRRTGPWDAIVVDLKHIEPSVFKFVLQYIYSDAEEELFDEVRANSQDQFVDLVLDVMFVANELMIDRLAQICQKVLGQFVNTRNVCHLLNSVAPCATTNFKVAALEFICLNLEDMLENRLLDDLDGDLLRELDAVCLDNQVASYPVSRGRNSEDYAFEKYPELASLVGRDRQRNIDYVRLRSWLNRAEVDDERSRPAIVDKAPTTPQPRKGKLQTPIDGGESMVNSPLLKAKHSIGDLMFQMDDEALLSPASGKRKAAVKSSKFENPHEARPSPESISPVLGPSLVENGSFGARKDIDARVPSAPDNPLVESPLMSRSETVPVNKMSFPSSPDVFPKVAWGSPSISRSKKDLKDIMAEASQSRISNITIGMSERREGLGGFAPKLSQKERKKLQQQQMQEKLSAEQKPKEATQSPWQLATPNTSPQKSQSQNLVDGQTGEPDSARSAQKAALTLRQTIAKTPPLNRPKPGSAAGQTQDRAASTPMQSPWNPPRTSSSTGPSLTRNTSAATPQPAVQSIRHIPRLEPCQTSLQSPSPGSLSLATILMQQQTEKDEVREAAVAKRSLQDIQLEQEFQEWWDQESKRVMELAEAEAAAVAPQNRRGGRSGRGKGPTQRKRRGLAPAGLELDSSAKSSPAQPSPVRNADQPHTGSIISRRYWDDSSSGQQQSAGGNNRRGARGGSRPSGRGGHAT